MKTITINVDDEVERRFRMEKKMKSAEVQTVDLLGEGLEMGKVKFKQRDELHER